MPQPARAPSGRGSSAFPSPTQIMTARGSGKWKWCMTTFHFHCFHSHSIRCFHFPLSTSVSEIEDQLDTPILFGGQEELFEERHAGEITNQQACRARVGASSKPGRSGNRFLPLGSLSKVNIGAGDYTEATVLPGVRAGFGTRLHREAV